MTDEEIWDFLIENEKMAWWFSNRAVGYKRSKYFISYLWEEAFKIIKSGGLERGTIGTVFKYATMTALRTWECKDASRGICVPLHFFAYKKAIKKGLDKGEDLIHYKSDTSSMTADEARIVLMAMTKLKSERVEIDDNTMSIDPIPDLYLVHNIELDTDWDMHVDIDDLFRYLTEFFTKKARKRNYEYTWKDLKRAKASLYCLGRRYGMETRIMRLAPEIYGLGKEYDLVTPYIKDIKEMAKRAKASKKGMNVKLEFECRKEDYDNSTAADASLATIGKELGVTRERVRQHLVYLEKILSEYTS